MNLQKITIRTNTRRLNLYIYNTGSCTYNHHPYKEKDCSSFFLLIDNDDIKKTKIAVGDVKLSLRKSRKNRIGADGELFRAKKREFSEIPQQTDSQRFITYHISTAIPPSCNNACFSP